MRRALAGRLAFAIALVLVAFTGAWLLTALAPGDPLDDGVRSQASLAAARARLGMDQPILTRLSRRIAGLATLDLGTSLRYDQPVWTLVTDRAARTLEAGVVALLLALAIGIPAGVAGSRSPRPLVRRAIMAGAVALLSVPALVVALVVALVAAEVGLSSFVVMVVALALPAAALVTRLQARALDGVRDATCLAAAQARGVPASIVTWRHAWPLSLPAVLGLLGVIAGQVLGGAIAVELVTSRSGLGLLTLEALTARDLDLAAGCAGAAAAIVGACTLASDALLAWIDPRVRDDG